jgi:hypothetical protein
VAADLHDLRAKVTVQTHCALTAYSRAHQQDVSELVRDILDKWAGRQIHGATVLVRCLTAKGETAAAQGIAGNGKSLDWTEADDV